MQSFNAAATDSGVDELLVQANAALLDLDGESVAVFKILREQYACRFPELESFELNSLQYARVVLALGGGDFGSVDVSAALQSCHLPAAVVMIVAVTASTTKGRILTLQEAAQVKQTAEMIIRMSSVKAEIIAFVEARMDRVAPNVTALVGVSVASQLIGAAGGIIQLSRIPAGNIQVVGSGGRKHLAGLSSASASLHAGFIAMSPLVEEVDPEYRKNALRLLSAK